MYMYVYVIEDLPNDSSLTAFGEVAEKELRGHVGRGTYSVHGNTRNELDTCMTFLQHLHTYCIHVYTVQQ